MKWLISFIPIFIFAGIINDFKSGNYEKICTYQNVEKHRKDEKLLSIVGVACVKIDKINMLPYIVNKLAATKIGRQNAIFFSTIYLQKKLIYAFLMDNFDINGFDFPKTPYILSTIFEAIKNGNITKNKNGYCLTNKNICFYIEDGKIVVKDNSKRRVIR